MTKTLSALLCGLLLAGFASPVRAARIQTVDRASAHSVVAGQQPAQDPLTALQQSIISAAARASPSVVLIRNAMGLGSGDVIDTRGFIVTNYHVLSGGAGRLQPPFTVTLASGKTYPATVVGTDAADDLAVLKIEAGTLTPITMRDSSTLKVGQLVLVIGNPLGYAHTVTFGVISTLGRGLPEAGPATYLPDLIQTSAPIYPGSSGGALVDLQGRLAGIPVMTALDPRQSTLLPGLGFAIPANRVRFITDQIIRTGRVDDTGRADLGLTGVDATAPAQPDTMPVPFGARVLEVESN